MDRDPSGSKGAEVIDIAPYINGRTPRDIGKVVYASFLRGGSEEEVSRKKNQARLKKLQFMIYLAALRKKTALENS